jgi:hypothetical protein
VAGDIDRLRGAIAIDRRRRDPQLHLGYEAGDPGEIDFLAVKGAPFDSPVSGGAVMAWTGEVEQLTIPRLGNFSRAKFVDRPRAYWIPAAWADLGGILDLHQIRYERIEAPTEVRVEMTRIPGAQVSGEAYEGHVRVTPGEMTATNVTATFRPGALRVPTDQPAGTLAMLLLEPASDDSFFQWGMMLEVLQRTEYFEAYVMEPMARKMMEEDAELARAFEDRLANDEEFAENPRARLEFFYERSPYFDQEYRVYPVMREMN